MKDLGWFGPKFTIRSIEFVYKNKKGRKLGHRYKKATSALMIDDLLIYVYKTQNKLNLNFM